MSLVVSDPKPVGAAITRHPLGFLGSGGEYFKVWLVNVVLMVVTIGLFTPFARRRTAQYFYNHTEIAGSPLEFTATIGRMMTGFLVVTAAYAAYELASWFEYQWAVNAILMLAALAAPFLWGSAMRFRTRATRWRGIRPLFVASWGEIYRQSWPVFAVALIWIGAVAAFNFTNVPQQFELAQAMERLENELDKVEYELAEIEETQEKAEAEAPSSEAETQAAQPESADVAQLKEKRQRLKDQLDAPPYQQYEDSSEAWLDGVRQNWPVLLTLGLGGLAASLPFVVLLEFNYRRLFVTRTQIGGQFGRWKPTFTDFLRVWLATIGVSVISLALGLALLLLVAYVLILLLAASMNFDLGFGLITALLVLVLGLVFLSAAASPLLAYKQARTFQLQWNNIGVGQVARFKCRLGTWAFVRLRLLNFLLNLLTLGIYRPYARTAEYRMKLESVTLYVKGDLDELEGQISREQGALGDAFADMIGLDVIA